jgi:hypothetical protein
MVAFWRLPSLSLYGYAGELVDVVLEELCEACDESRLEVLDVVRGTEVLGAQSGTAAVLSRRSPTNAIAVV